MKKLITALFFIVFIIYNCKENTKAIPPKNTSTSNAFHISSNEGKKWNILGMKITGKILSNETDGKYSVIVTETRPKGGPPMHVHTHEDELFYILKGNYEFYFGNEKIKAKEGDLIHLPKGIPHKFKNIDSIPGITMNTITPGGFESFFDDIANLSKIDPPTKHEIDSIAQIYGVKFINQGNSYPIMQLFKNEFLKIKSKSTSNTKFSCIWILNFI